MVAFEDGANADRMASDYKRLRSQVTKAAKFKIKLAPGGGWAARIKSSALTLTAHDSLSIRSAARLADLVAASIPQFRLSAYAPAK